MSKADELYYQYRRKLNKENNTRQGYRREKSTGQGTRNERYISEVLGGQGEPVQSTQTPAPASAPKTRQQILNEYRKNVVPAPKVNPFDNITHQNPVTQGVRQQTGWMDPNTKALWEIANQGIGKQEKISPASLQNLGGLNGYIQTHQDEMNSLVKLQNRQLREQDRRRRQQEAFDNARARQVEKDKLDTRPEWLGGQSVGEYMHDYMNDPALNKSYDADTVRRYNEIYDTQGPAAARQYVMSQTNEDNTNMERIDAALLGAAGGTGISSLAGVIGGRNVYEPVARETQRLQEAHPIASAGGSIAGNLALMGAIGGAVGAGANALRARAAVNPTTLRIGSSALNFALTSAVQQAGALRSGLVSGDDYVRNMLVSGAGGAASSVASMAVGAGIEDILRKTGSQTMFLDYVKNVASSTAGAAARIGIDYGAEDKTPTRLFRENYLAVHAGATEEDIQKAYSASLVQKAGVQFVTAFAMNLLSSYMETNRTNMQNFEALKQEYESLEKDMEVLGTVRFAEGSTEDLESWNNVIHERTSKLRDALSNNYFGGQQENIDRMLSLLDAIDERATQAVNLQSGYWSGSVADGTGEQPSAGFTAAIDSAMRQGAEEAGTAPAPSGTTADMLAEIANTPYNPAPENETVEPEVAPRIPTIPAPDMDAAADQIDAEMGAIRQRNVDNLERQRQIEEGIQAIDTAPTEADEVNTSVDKINTSVDNINAEIAARRQENAANTQRRQEIEQGIPAPSTETTAPSTETTAPSTEEMLREIANTEAGPVATSQQQAETPAQGNRTPAPELKTDETERETDETERETAPAVTSSSAVPSTDELASIFPEGAAEVYKKYAGGEEDIAFYHDNMLKAYQAGTKEQSLQNLMLNDEDFEDFWYYHEDAVEDIYRQGFMAKVQRDNKNRIEQAKQTKKAVPGMADVTSPDPTSDNVNQQFDSRSGKPDLRPSASANVPREEVTPPDSIGSTNTLAHSEAARKLSSDENQIKAQAPLNEAPAGSKIESGKKFKVKDGDIQVAANRIFKDARKKGGTPTGSLIGDDGRQYFTDGAMAVVLNQQVEGIGVQGETDTWHSEDAAKYINVLNKGLETARAQKDGMYADYPSFHKAIGSLSKTKMTEYNGKKLFSFDGDLIFDFGPSAQMLNARKMETALRMIENPEVYYSDVKTPVYIKGDNGEAIIFGLNYPKAKRFLYGNGQATEAQNPAPRTEFATAEASKLSSDLFQRKRVDQNGFRYSVRGDDGQFFGSIERIGEGTVRNARDTVYTVGPKATIQEVADDLAAVAENNRFLEVDNGEIRGADRDGSDGTADGYTPGGIVQVAGGTAEGGDQGAGETRTGGLRGMGADGQAEPPIPGLQSEGNADGIEQRHGEGSRGTGVRGQHRPVGVERHEIGSGDKQTLGTVFGSDQNTSEQQRDSEMDSEQHAEGDVGDDLSPAAREKVEEGVPESAATPVSERPADTQAEVEASRAADIPPKGTNFVIPPEGLKLPNGEKARFKANVAAIKTLRTLMADSRQATPEEQVVLSKYVGWGGLKNAFNERDESWSKEFKQLKNLLSDEEYKTARGSVLNAHYTEVGVIRAIYNGLKGMGFTGGRILEPAAGVGHFAGAMPSDIRVQSLTMVELDNITGNIAKYLYPNADVRVQGFETANLPDNYMDLAISNVPFGNYGIFDKSYPKAVTGAIHNYFFAKSLDKVRPGGLVCFITSRYTMDAKDSSVRDYIMKKADLVGAIRLPDSAFKSNAGTDVVTDILVLKKREAGTPYSGEAFKNAEYYHQSLGVWEQTNEYFQSHPDMVLGEASKTGTMYRSNSLTYKALPGKLNSQIEKAFSKITAKMDYPSKQSPADIMRQNRNEIRRASGTAKNGSYVKSNGQLYKNENGSLVETGLKAKEADIISASVDIRDMARELLNLQMNNGDAKEISRLREKLNTAYDNFVSKYGPLHSRTNSRLISGDSDSPFIFALENYNSDTKKAEKADIFLKNTVTPHRIIEHVENMADGLAASLNDSGTVDIPLISKVTGKTEAETTKELINQKLAFKTKDGTLQSAQQYLSGNVRAKLKEARALATIDPDFKKNVEELEKVVPKDIEPADISVKPGATWVPPDLYADFAAEMLGTTNQGWRKTIEVTYVPAAGVYKVAYGPGGRYVKGNSFDVSEYGTADKSFVQIFEAALNNKDLKVYFPHGKNEKAVLNRKATIAVKEKKNKILQKFQEWMWSDEERVKAYAPLYNDMFNNSAVPNYDGSKLTIEGLSTNFSLKEHQANAVQRIIMSGGNTLLAHGTGSGKTLEMAAAAMKLRQIGAIKKPMFVVPKNLVGQWGNEFYSYFPGAKILITGEKDFNTKNRKAFANKIATGDWDAVILSYEQFRAIPLSMKEREGFYRRQIDEILTAQEAARESEGKRSFTVKALEKKRKSLEAKLRELDSGKKDEDNIEFESLGVDSLFVDEAHAYKNLFYSTQLQNVGDLGDSNGSERAFDLYTKVKYLQSVNGGRGIVFGTATPIMNSVVEMYSMQRYLQGDLLEQNGISNFDAWVNEFGDVQEIQKIKNGGDGYETKTSLARYRNLGELQQMFRGFADVVTNPPGLADKLPKLRTGAPIVVECEPTDVQREYLKELGKRSEAVRHSKDLKEDNILKIYSDGKKMSYTQRMIDPSLPYEDGGKIMKCVENVLKEYKASSANKGTQLVFCDTGVEGSNAKDPLPLWRDIKNMLIAGGIPEKEIAFKQSGLTDAKKEILQKKVIDGDIRVLIGSTGTMGTGLNVQKRLFAMHEINAPDRPGDVEQNRGRIVRQGNDNKEVAIYTYITKETFDSRQWDNLKRKSAFIHQAMAGDVAGRTVDGDGDFSMSAAEISALASGNPLIIEQNEVSTKISQLEALESEHIKQISAANRKIAELPRQIEQLQNRIADYTKDAKAMPDLSGDKFSVNIAGKEYTKRADAGKAIISEAKGFFSLGDEGAVKKIGTVGSFDLMISNKGNAFLKGNAQYDFTVNMESPEGTTRSLTNAASMPQTRLDNAKAELLKNQSELTRYQEIAKKKFEHEEELNTLRNREAEIMEELNPSNERGVDYVDEGVKNMVSSSSDVKNMVSSGADVKNAAASAQSYESQWEAKRVGDADKAPMSLTDLIGKIRHDLGLSITTGNIRGNRVRGQFNAHDKGIRTKIANDLPSLAHEVGHYFDQKYSIIGEKLDEAVKKELETALKKDLGADADKYRKDQRESEGFAEYVRQYMQNREEAAIAYPKLTAHLKSKLSARGLAEFNNIADEINAYYSLDAENAQSAIRLKEEGGRDFRTVGEKIRDMGDDLYQTWVDSNHAIKRFDDATGRHAYKLASNAAYSDAIAGQLIVGDLTDVNGRYVGPGLKTALHGIDLTDRPTYIAFNEYLVCRHGQSWLEDGKRVFADDRKNSTAFMQRRVSELEAQYDNFKDAADRLVEFVRNFTQTWGVNTGLISQETLDAWNEKYPDYVPLYRMTEKGTPGAKRGFANQNSPYKRAKSSGLDIMAPVDGIMDQIVRVTNTALRNNVMLEMRRAYKASPDADANFISPVPAPLRPKTFDMTGLKSQLAGDITDAMMGGTLKTDAQGAKELASIIDSINDTMLQFERGRAKDNVVTILVNGEKEYWQVNDKKLLESIGNMNPAKISGLLEAYANTTRFLTANITGNNPIWSIFSNAPRDLGTFLVYSKSNRNKLYQVSKIGEGWINSVNANLRDGKNVDPLYSEYLAMGGGFTSAYSADSDLAKKARKELTSNKRARTMDTMNPLNWVSFMTDTIEQGPRFATYKLMRESGLSPQEAFYEAMDVTVNFRKAGAMSRQVNKVVPFFNAGLQGADKFARFFSAEDVAGKNRGSAAAARFGSWTAASVAIAGLIYALNGRDEENRKQYSQLSNYTKNNYWCIPLGDGQFFAIPKPRELASMTSFAESVMDFTVGGNQHGFDEYYDYAADVFLPGIASDLAQLPVHAARDGIDPAVTEFSDRAIGSMGIIGAFHDLSANRDFLGRSIVSASLEDYEPKDQFTRSTSKAAYWIGRGLNYSPQKIDYLGNQVLGYWWKIQKALFPVGEEYIDRSLGVKNTYFKDNVYSQDLVNWIYDEAEKSARKYKSSQKPEDGLKAKNDENMKKFYGNFYKLSKDETDSKAVRKSRQLVLDMVNDYRSFTDTGIMTPVQEALYGLVTETGDTSLLPATMQTYVKDGSNKYELKAAGYIDYQTRYNELYWQYIEDNLDLNADTKAQTDAVKAAKKIAAESAATYALGQMGIVPEKKSKSAEWVDQGYDLADLTAFNAAKEAGNQDGAAEYLNSSGLSEAEKHALWELAGWADSSYDKKVN